MRLLGYLQLKELKGISYSPQWIFELVKRGLFPAPLKCGPGSNGSNYWVEAEIDAWLETKAAQRVTDKTEAA